MNIEKALQKIKTEGEKLKNFSDEDIHDLKEKLTKSLDREKWFALVQEISFRSIGLRHYDTQLRAGLLLDEGKVVEMKTGEGKTLASTLSVSFNALEKKGVHVITVNDYLAERDAKWMGKLYYNLGLTTGLVLPNQNISERKKNYNQDITYVTNSTVVFDYLKDNLVKSSAKIAQRSLYYCLIDEIDSILIDEARVPLIISDSIRTSSLDFTELQRAQTIAEKLEESLDFEVDRKKKEISLTERGYEKIEIFFFEKKLYSLENSEILSVLNALRVKYFYLRDIDYLVAYEKIILIDEFTGRPMADRRWSFGIQEAIETKEGIFSPNRSSTRSSITYQSFFPEYEKICGMTGTALSSENEFKNTYKLEVIAIPPFKKLIRKDLPDEVYSTLKAKWLGVVQKAEEAFKKGQPMLIGTSSIENSELLSAIFVASRLPHSVLNARPENAGVESKIIAQAGQLYSLTIATNMAGRGTDIILGGNIEFRIKESIFEIFEEINKVVNYLFKTKKNSSKQILSNQGLAFKKTLAKKKANFEKFSWKKILYQLSTNVLEDYKDNFVDLLNQVENLPYSLNESKLSLKVLYYYLQKEFLPDWEKEKKLVKKAGGLFVIGTERSENLRIDDQLRGRAGRQGDPGMSQFLVSLDDTIFQRYSTQRLKALFGKDPEVPMKSEWIDFALRNIQKKIENLNYETRRNLLTYNKIENFERKFFFRIRYKFLTKNYPYYSSIFSKYPSIAFPKEKKTGIGKVFYSFFSFLDKFFLSSRNFSNFSFELFPGKDEDKKQKFSKFPLTSILPSSSVYSITSKFFLKEKLFWIRNDLFFSDLRKYKIKPKKRKFLSLMDNRWAQQLQKNNFFRENIRWRSYAQKDPVDEFNFESYDSYQALMGYLRYSLSFEEDNYDII